MTKDQYIIQRKVNIIWLGATLDNISDAYRKLGVSRQHYYDIKQAIAEDGLEGLLEKSRKAPRMGNRVSPDIEQRVLDYRVFPFVKMFVWLLTFYRREPDLSSRQVLPHVNTIRDYSM